MITIKKKSMTVHKFSPNCFGIEKTEELRKIANGTMFVDIASIQIKDQ